MRENVTKPTASSPARAALAELLDQASTLRQRIDGLAAPHDRADELLAEEEAAIAEVSRIEAQIEAEAGSWLCGDAAQRPADRTGELSAALARRSAATAQAAAVRRLQAGRVETERVLQAQLAVLLATARDAKREVLAEQFEIEFAAAVAARASAAAADARLYGLIGSLHSVATQLRDAGDEDAARPWSLRGEELSQRLDRRPPPAPTTDDVEHQRAAWDDLLRRLAADASAEVANG
jgi:hypothetical protein